MCAESFLLPVRDIVEETCDAYSIVLDVPPEARGRFRHHPGQHLTIAVPDWPTGVSARCYSISSSPVDVEEGAEGPLTITIRRAGDGHASDWIIDNVEVGDSLRALPPSGVFRPRSLDDDLLMFAGGSGITPIMSIIRTVLARGSGRLVLFYANRDERSVIFGSVLAELAAEHTNRFQVVHWLDSVQGTPSKGQLKAFAAPYAEYSAFVCGPVAYTETVLEILTELNFPRSRRHREVFTSPGNPFRDIPQNQVLKKASADAANVRVPRTRSRVEPSNVLEVSSVLRRSER